MGARVPDVSEKLGGRPLVPPFPREFLFDDNMDESLVANWGDRASQQRLGRSVKYHERPKASVNNSERTNRQMSSSLERCTTLLLVSSRPS